MDMLSQTPPNAHASWRGATKEGLGVDHSVEPVDWALAVAARFPEWPSDRIHRFTAALQRIGLLSAGEPFTVTSTKLDSLCSFLQGRLAYGPGERDMVFMHHEFIVSSPDGREMLTSTLCQFGQIGDGHDSAMSVTVGLPVAVAARAVLEGKIKDRGVLVPTSRQVYGPIMGELGELGIRFAETRLLLNHK